MGMDNEKALVVTEAAEVEVVAPLSAQAMRARVNLIQEVMAGVMKDGEHYGVIPGCGKKPTLLKPGAEKLLSTFQIAPEFKVEDLSNLDSVRYRVTARGLSSSGCFLGEGVGECSTMEDKYKWRKCSSQLEYEATAEDRRRQKYTSYGAMNQVRTEPYDYANTVLKMAKKRALVDMVLTVTAASDIFTQDIEEMEFLHEKPKVQEKRKANPKPQPKEDVPLEPKVSEFVTVAHFEELEKFRVEKGWPEGELPKLLSEEFGCDKFSQLTLENYESFKEIVLAGPAKWAEVTL